MKEPSMDHREIQENHILDRYLAGELSDEEAERFEQHLLECPTCSDEVRWGEDFRESLRTAAAEDQVRATATVGLLAWLAHHSRIPRWMVLLGGLLLAALPAAWLLWQQGRLRHALAMARAAAAETEQKVREQSLPRAPETPSQTAQDVALRRRLEEELQRQREASARLQEELHRRSRPQAATLVSLGLVRGEGSSADGPRIRLDPQADWIVLSVELPATEFPIYRATLLDSRGKVLWRGERLEPSLYETLLINVPGSFLSPGGYRLHLEGLEAGDAPALAGELSFRVVAPSD